MHFFVVELRGCLLPASQCSHHRFAGTNSQGILSGFNKTVLKSLPRSRNLIVVESVLMAVAFVAMLLVRPGVGGRGDGAESLTSGGIRVQSGRGLAPGQAAAWRRGLRGEPGLSPRESPR